MRREECVALSGARRVLRALILVALAAPFSQAMCEETWTILATGDLAGDAAIRAAIEDLQRDGPRFGIQFVIASQTPSDLGNVIVVGSTDPFPAVARLLDEREVSLEDVANPEGYQLCTLPLDTGRVIVVNGGSLQGSVYGLYWIWDRLRVFGRIPDLNLTRAPKVGVRFTGGGSEETIRNALRYSANGVFGSTLSLLVPWDSEPEATENRAHREETRTLIDAAHAYHMKFLAMGDEFLYLPSFLEEFSAKLDPADPRLWDALQAKYRRLFNALPELDGVQIRTGELTRRPGNYEAFDIMHEPAESDWGLEDRYRKFIRKMHEVIVGEYDKIYFHRTWVTNTTEQHSRPDVYKAIFTDDVPTRNLYLSPYLSLTDRWYYQPYNPTFNLTPHAMVVLLATLDYHATGGTKVFPSFPGSYHQKGLQRLFAPRESNVKGIHWAVPAKDEWNTATVTAYTVFRLAWDPDESLETIAHDLASIYFGREAALQIGEMLLLSQQAYKDGIYIKPVAESIVWNTLPHLRLTTFGIRGFPKIDHGRAHIEWLNASMYSPSKERLDEALEYLARGLKAARKMESLYREISSEIVDPLLAEKTGNAVRLTRLLVETNNEYVRTCFAYFRYRGQPTQPGKETLLRAVTDLKDVRRRFVDTPGFAYKLFGIDQLVRNADAALEDLAQAEEALATALTTEEVERAIAKQQWDHTKTLEERSDDAVRFLKWRGDVDGKDILRIRAQSIAIEHIQSDSIQSMTHTFFKELPREEVTVLVKDVTSRQLHPFILEQPTRDNDYTCSVYLFDTPGSYGQWEFELYYIRGRPEDLAIPWQEAHADSTAGP